MSIATEQFGGVVVALLTVGALLKHAWPKFPSEKIPLVTFILGTLAYVALTHGWSNVEQWIAGVVASVTATGIHSGLKHVLIEGKGEDDAAAE